MKLIDQLNMYFGTEHKDVPSFIKDIRKGDLHDDYYDEGEKVVQLLMFLNALDTALEGDSNG